MSILSHIISSNEIRYMCVHATRQQSHTWMNVNQYMQTWSRKSVEKQSYHNFRQSMTGLSGNLVRLRQRLRHLCFSYVYGYDPHKHSNLSKEEIIALRNLHKQENIVICRPDKGNGVVVLDRSEYLRKLKDVEFVD